MICGNKQKETNCSDGYTCLTLSPQDNPSTGGLIKAPNEPCVVQNTPYIRDRKTGSNAIDATPLILNYLYQRSDQEVQMQSDLWQQTEGD